MAELIGLRGISKREKAKIAAKKLFIRGREAFGRAVERRKVVRITGKQRRIERRAIFRRKARGIAFKAGRRAGKELGQSLRGFAKKIGEPSKAEKETVIIIGGKPKRVKGRVRIVRVQQEPFVGDLGVGGMGDLGLSVNLFDEKPRKKRKDFRFF